MIIKLNPIFLLLVFLGQFCLRQMNQYYIPVVDPGFPVGGGVDPLGGRGLQCRCSSVKMYAKMKELGPIAGGACARHAP